jgi:ankyrin repeat protein
VYFYTLSTHALYLQSEYTVLQLAARVSNYKVVESLLHAGAVVNARGEVRDALYVCTTLDC